MLELRETNDNILHLRFGLCMKEIVVKRGKPRFNPLHTLI